MGLIASYNLTSAISAGFSSNNAQNWVNGWSKSSSFFHTSDNTLFSGALSQGIGGAISNAGNNILANGGGWTKYTGFSFFSGFTSSFVGQVAHNAVGLIPFMSNISDNNKTPFSSVGSYLLKAFSSFSANIASGVTQQLIGNGLGEWGARNGYNVAPYNIGQYIAGPASYWWGSYINGLG